MKEKNEPFKNAFTMRTSQEKRSRYNEYETNSKIVHLNKNYVEKALSANEANSPTEGRE